MCFTISININDEAVLEKKFGATFPSHQKPFKKYYAVSGFLHPDWPVLTCENPTEFQVLNWGLIPAWSANAELAEQFSNNNLNARAESVFEKPSFRNAIRKQRCIIPVTGFFEWRHALKKTYPYHIQLVQHDIFCLGGIYDTWVNKETGEIKKTFSIVTTEANALMAKIHNTKLRMPLILAQEDMPHWLNPNLPEYAIQSLLKPFDAQGMTAHTIGKRITSRTENPNSPETLALVEYPELALLDTE